jgi:hypothetical protein
VQSIQQCRAQLEILDSLEQRVGVERQKFQAMLQHLQMRNDAQKQINAVELQTSNLLQSASSALPQKQLETALQAPNLSHLGINERVEI